MSPRGSRKPPPPKSRKDADDAFARQARKVADGIRKDSAGRVCGDCAHSVLSTGGTGACMALVNIHGHALSIVRHNAVACRDDFVKVES